MTIEEPSIDSFLEEVAKLTDRGGGPLFPVLKPGVELARRYRLIRAVGRGAHGVVWAAHDSLSGEDVAVKVLLPAENEEAARVCAEVASLRRLRLLGVVRLLDDGMEAGSLFLVMPFVRGEPFPGRQVPAPWEAIAPAARSILRVIGEVHAAGITHRDLKPGNVLVDERGDVTVLDFGLALAPTFDGLWEDGRIAGTPAYLAPEQAASGPIGSSADLYAIGVMLYRALSGRFPHEASTVLGLLAAKRNPPAPLASVARGVPPHVAKTIDELLATAPADRPASALAALERLETAESGSGSPSRSSRPALLAGVTAPLTPEAIRDLFEGRDRLAWTREDAARLLFERTHGEPERLRAEIDAWVRAGRCRLSAAEPRLVIDDEIVDRLEMGFDLGSSHDPLGFAEEATNLASKLAVQGRLGNATALLRDALSALRRSRGFSPVLAVRALSVWVEVALAAGTPRALDHVLYEICRMEAASPLVRDLEALVRAAMAVGAWTERALELASTIPRFQDPALERLRQGVRVMATRRVSLEREEALMLELGEAIDSAPAETRAALSGWSGRLRYRQGRFVEAAALHGAAAEQTSWATRRASALVAQASALMEAFQLDEAAGVAARALEVASTSRHVFGRAMAEWLVRLIGYRRGDAIIPDLEWVEAVASLRMSELEALVCVTEASLAWRARELDTALVLATRAKQVYTSVGERGGGLLLATALAVACAPDAASPAEVESLASEASACEVPGVGIQVLGLLAPAWQGRPPDPARLAALAEQVARAHWHLRIDILSVDEALVRLQGLQSAVIVV
jgi:hypothetical protein